MCKVMIQYACSSSGVQCIIQATNIQLNNASGHTEFQLIQLGDSYGTHQTVTYRQHRA